MFATFVNFVLGLVQDMGYWGIVFLMALESSFIPFPSEVVVPPAGYLAAQGKMNIYFITLAGTVGSTLGALVNYYIAYYFGNKFLRKNCKYFFLTEEKLDKMEHIFRKHGDVTTFTGRLIPVVRQYISFPAGLAAMNIPKFCFYTGLGAGIWVIILAWLGFFVGSNPELLHSRLTIVTILLIGFVILTLLVYFYLQRNKRGV